MLTQEQEVEADVTAARQLWLEISVMIGSDEPLRRRRETFSTGPDRKRRACRTQTETPPSGEAELD